MLTFQGVLVGGLDSMAGEYYIPLPGSTTN